MKKKVLVTGELNVDIILNRIQGFPARGEEILAGDMTLAMGSSSAIFAANIASLGISTSFCGMVGKDLFGEFMLAQLQAKNVDTSLVTKTSAWQTGLTMVLNYGEDRANITHPGAMEHFSLEDIALEKLTAFNHLHFSSYFLQKGLQKDIVYLFKTAREHGLSTSLDLQWDPSNEWHFPYETCLPHVDFFMPNEAEILSLTGTRLLEDAFTTLRPFSNTIIVKRGAHGAIAYQNGSYTESASYSNPAFVDAIGAGDSFNAGFICSFLRGDGLEQSLRFGNLAGAMNTTAAGGTAAFSDPASFAEKAKRIFNLKIELQ